MRPVLTYDFENFEESGLIAFARAKITGFTKYIDLPIPPPDVSEILAHTGKYQSESGLINVRNKMYASTSSATDTTMAEAPEANPEP